MGLKVHRMQKNEFFQKLSCTTWNAKKYFWRVLSSWWLVSAFLKSQNALKKGYFWTKNVSKMVQKCVFPKMMLDHSGCTNK